MTLAELLDEVIDEKINREGLAAQEPGLIQALDRAGLHSTQIITVLRVNREAIMEGVTASEALRRAFKRVGAPAKKRYEVWDERLRSRSE